MLEKILILTIIIEVLSIGGRLIFGSMRKRMKQLKSIMPVRIHHGYVGIACLFMYALITYELLIITGVSLIASDFIHHFIVLPVWVGDNEFP